MKTTETDFSDEFTRPTQSLRFTTYVVTSMKSLHLLSTVHDLAICTRSVQSSRKRRFHHYESAISTILGEVFTQTGLTALPSHQQYLSPANCTSSNSARRSLASANHTNSIRIPRSSPDLGYPAWCPSSFHLASPRSILVGLLLLTAVI